MSVSPQTLLDSVEAAISTFLAGGAISEYTLANGRTVKRESVAELQKLRVQLQAEVAATVSGGGLYTRVGFGGPS